jgi:tripartite-type tricarboxylate transporter receptor subunit TctC
MKLAVFVLALLLPCTAIAQGIGCSPLRIVVPYPAGGAADVGARLLGQAVAPKLGTPVVIENKAGASGNLGTEYVVGSAKDGCTLLLNSSALASFPDSFATLRFDPFADLVVLSAIGTTPTVIVTANQAIATLAS